MTRRGRACPGYPRGEADITLQGWPRAHGVGGRDEPGQDGDGPPSLGPPASPLIAYSGTATLGVRSR
jgi:hypothetical protein